MGFPKIPSAEINCYSLQLPTIALLQVAILSESNFHSQEPSSVKDKMAYDLHAFKAARVIILNIVALLEDIQ